MPVLTVLDEFPSYELLSATCLQDMPEHAALYLPSLTADRDPLGMQNLTIQLHQLRTTLKLPSASSSR